MATTATIGGARLAQLPRMLACLLGLIVVSVAMPASPADAEASARKAHVPRLIAAATGDSDGDGRIDSVKLTWSDPVKPRGRQAGIRVEGYRVVGLRGADRRARSFSLALAEGSSTDTAERPTVKYSGGATGEVVAASGKRAGTCRAVPVDGARPVLVEARLSGGWPASGSVITTWSEPVVVAPSASARFALADEHGAAIAVASATPAADSAEVALNPPLYGLVPRLIAYIDAAGGAVEDAAGNRGRTTTLPLRVSGAITTPPPPATETRPTSSVATGGKGGTIPPPTPTPTPPPTPPPPTPPPTTPTPTPPPPATPTPPPSGSGGSSAPQIVGSVFKPIDPSQIVGWGQRSHWRQPWRSYQDTWPVSRMRNAIGINFNVRWGQAESAARLLAANGFTRARLEIGWGDVDYKDPTQLKSLYQWKANLLALKAHGIRPLILLNANHNQPCPFQLFTARVTAPANAGDRTLQVDSATLAQIVADRSGLNSLTGGGKIADVLFTSVDPTTSTVTLSKPLPVNLAAGTYKAATLLYAPFGSPFKPDGTPNPVFDQTMQGWLDYVAVVTGAAKNILGDDNFDVEIWNEMTFGSDFLYAGRYYNPAPAGQGVVTDEILNRTVAWLRNPAHGVSGIGIGNGFANQRPWEAGSNSPAGLTAIDKHPYKNRVVYPRDNAPSVGIVPLDAQGQAAYTNVGAWPPLRVDNFTPSYIAFLPEYFLTSLQTENLVRDIGPVVQNIGSIAHGRNTAPAGGTPPEMWITEYNMDLAGGADPSDPSNISVGSAGQITPQQLAHLQAKVLLRTISSYVSKGVAAVHFYAAAGGGSFGLINQSFINAIGTAGTGAYPGDGSGGEPIDVMGRFSSAFTGSGPNPTHRSISLDRIDDFTGTKQFEGNGTPQFPALYNRDSLAFFPFQSSDSSFVVPVYVVTRDVERVYQTDLAASDPKRFDMPEETYRLTVGGVDGTSATVSAVDPLTGSQVPVDVVSRSSGQLVLDMPVTDSPRLLKIDNA